MNKANISGNSNGIQQVAKQLNKIVAAGCPPQEGTNLEGVAKQVDEIIDKKFASKKPLNLGILSHIDVNPALVRSLQGLSHAYSNTLTRIIQEADSDTLYQEYINTGNYIGANMLIQHKIEDEIKRLSELQGEEISFGTIDTPEANKWKQRLKDIKVLDTQNQ